MNENLDNEFNEYIDGNLGEKELQKLNNILLNDSNAVSKLRSLKSVHNILSQLEIESASDNLSKRVLERINQKKLNRNKNYFFRVIVFSFVLGILAFTGYAVYLSKSFTSNSNSMSVIKNILNQSSEYFSIINLQLSSNIFIIVFSAITLIILLSFYFIVSTHNSFIKKLNNFA